MPKASRMGDQWYGICCCHDKDDPDEDGTDCIPMGGIIITASGNSGSNGQGQARVGDLTIGWCGHTGMIISGSATSLMNSLGKARIGEGVFGCNIGDIITGSPNHEVGG